MFVICALLVPIGAAGQQRRTFDFRDYYKIVGISDPQISPDGKHVAIVVTRANETTDRNVDQIVIVDSETGASRVVKTGHDDASSPRWSPGGTRLSFIASAGSGEKAVPQIWVMPAEGGAAQQVTNAKSGVEVYAWRPDGKAIAYVTPDTPANEAAIARHDDLFVVGDEPFFSRSAPVASHLWLQILGGGNATRLTEGAWSVFPDQLSWSSDGKYIAFDREPSPGFDAFLKSSRVAVLDVASRHVREPDTRWSWIPSFAPVGDRLAYAAGGYASIVQSHLTLTSAPGGRLRDAAPRFNRNVTFLAWLPHGRGILVAANDRVLRGLWSVTPSGKTQRIGLGDLSVQEASVAHNGTVAFVAEAPKRPAELYEIAAGSAVTRLTEFNRDLDGLDLAPSHEFVWHNAGFEEDGSLTYPVGYVSGKRYPLVLVVHGCCGASQTSFDPLVQLLAARGFFVLQPNYRGSDNFGYAYAHAMIGDPVAGPSSDIVAGVRALEAAGFVDPKRVGVSGWSMGGWLTSWLLTHYDLWRAGVSGAAVDDAVMQYTLSSTDSLLPYLLRGATPWTPRGFAKYRSVSPIAFAANVKAPTLILSDTSDPNVATPESYEFYAALRDLGKAVKFLAAPATGHHPSDPVRNLAFYRAWVDWMVQYLSPN
jgi:dipeptidyl aminopeptidase/acylaminoacyl peptidase